MPTPPPFFKNKLEPPSLNSVPSLVEIDSGAENEIVKFTMALNGTNFKSKMNSRAFGSVAGKQKIVTNPYRYMVIFSFS